MSNSDFTKFMIARGMKQLLETKSFTEISVGELSRQCQISRNTFYYHFRDKYDVISWIFYTEITPIIGNFISLDQWGNGLRAMCHYIQENKNFYANVVQFEGQNSLADCLMDFYGDLTQNVILGAGGAELLSPQQIQLISRFYAHGMSGILLDWIKKGMIQSPDSTVDTLEDLLSGELMKQIISFQKHLEAAEGE